MPGSDEQEHDGQLFIIQNFQGVNREEMVNHGYNCNATKGQITLHAEGSEVEFRKIELTSIDIR